MQQCAPLTCLIISHGAKNGIRLADENRATVFLFLSVAGEITMRSALVLNATYEPLSVVSARRAICLVLLDKAEIVADDGTRVHSERFSVQSPVVIRLRYMVKVPYQRSTTMSRRAVFARDNHICGYCGGTADSIDHVMPRSRGGKNEWDNVIAACRGCNLRKRDRTPEEAGMKLAHPPQAPRELSWIMYSVPRIPEEWKPYLARAS
jgi:5-methylcytosine-specific restriction endonuclease McrA